MHVRSWTYVPVTCPLIAVNLTYANLPAVSFSWCYYWTLD
uniref:Uncharacterized protein n=1 Tax=Arundo donax TaxID=35708 RepID=A0A0A8Z7Q4_ARUDO